MEPQYAGMAGSHTGILWAPLILAGVLKLTFNLPPCFVTAALKCKFAKKVNKV